VILKIVLKDCHPYNGENQPMKEKESQNRNSDAAFVTAFRISKGF
jgi:hypothetical protein